MEVWKDIINYNGKYQISNLGNIKKLGRISRDTKRIYPEKFLKQSVKNGGYKFIRLKNEKRINSNIYVHRLLMIHFKYIEDFNKYQINHIDGNPGNNSLENLEWCTPSENITHSYRILNRKGNNLGRFGENSFTAVKINQYTLNNEFIKTWGSIKDANLFLNKTGSSISNCLTGRSDTAFGFIWRYKNKK